MTDYGVKSSGFVAKTLEQAQSDIIARMKAKAALGPTLDYGTASGLGQLAGVLAGSEAELWELGRQVWASMDPDAAADVPLDNVCSLTGTTRRAAAATVVRATVNLDAGTSLPVGTQASVDGRPDLVCELARTVTNSGGVTADFTLDDTGAPIEFVCTQTGPIEVSADTLTVMATSVSGWNSVTNPEPGIVGRDVESNVDLRIRRAAQLALRGGSTVRAIKAAVLEIPEVLSCIVLENKGDAADANGLPPHSFEVILDDGDPAAADDDDIAQAIFDHGDPAGIYANGTESGTATDEELVDHEVRFTRVERLDVYIDYTVTTNGLFPTNGHDLIKAAIVAAGNAYRPGDTAVALYLRSQAFTIAGVTDVPSFTLGYTASPVGTANLPATYRQRNTFDVARITGA